MAETIEVKGLVRAFGQLRAFDSLDLAVEEGAVHGFLGPNGSGKSTMIRCLLDLYRPDAGTVRVFGMGPSASAHGINRRVAYVPGGVALWPNLIGQQVLNALAALWRRRNEARERELVECSRLDSSRRIRAYSKGNRQEATPVAALPAPVDLLVLDEPTSGLDPLMEQIFGECIAQAKMEGRTVLLSSHILDEMQALCSHVTIIKDGVTVETGKLDRLRHLGAREIRVHGEESRLKSLFTDVEPEGVAVAWDEGDVAAEADAARVPAALSAVVAAGLADVTYTVASLEDLFLRHYEATVR